METDQMRRRQARKKSGERCQEDGMQRVVSRSSVPVECGLYSGLHSGLSGLYTLYTLYTLDSTLSLDSGFSLLSLYSLLSILYTLLSNL